MCTLIHCAVVLELLLVTGDGLFVGATDGWSFIQARSCSINLMLLY
jgi:hypothetical protein